MRAATGFVLTAKKSGGTHKDTPQEAHPSRTTRPKGMFGIKRREAMKKRLIIVAALVACMVVFTLMTGLVQAQSLDPSDQAEVVEADDGQEFVNPNDIFVRNCSIGPRGGDTF